MFDALFLLVGAGCAWWAHRFTACDDPGLRRLLAVFGGGLVLLAALVRGSAYASTPLAVGVLLALSVPIALAVWTATLRLVAVGTRPRDLRLRLPLLALAAVAFRLHMYAAALFVAIAGLLAWRWRDEVPARLQLLLSLAGFGLGLGGIEITSRALQPNGMDPLSRAAAGFVLVTTKVAILYALFGALVLLGAFVRDPTLGIRRVSRRLAFSHALVALIPLALLGILWAVITVLGVNQDRVKIAARVVSAENVRLRDHLREAMAAPDARQAIGALAVAERPAWPGLRVWLRDRDAFDQVVGRPLAVEPVLGDWLDSLGTLREATLVAFGDSTFVAAAVAAPGDSTGGAVALLPAQPVLEQASRVVGLEVRLLRRAGQPSVTNPFHSAAGESAAAAARPRRRSGTTILVAGADTFFTEPADTVGSLSRGYTVVPGMFHGPRGWRPRSFLLACGASTGLILSGLSDVSLSNPVAYLPLGLAALLAIGLFLIAIWDLMMVAGLGRSITAAIAALRVGAERLRNGDLAHRIPVEGSDDLWDVAGAFNHAAEGLERARALEKERTRIESELAVAQRIQSRLLPAEAPRLPGIEIAGYYEPAREVGGDYYDHQVIGDGRVLLVIADVSGKSVPAALIMSAFRAALVSQDLARAGVAELAERMNEFLHRSLDPGKFVTAFLAFLDARDGRLTYVNAGHNPPVLIRRDGCHGMLEEGGTILGILPGSTYVAGEAVLEPGDLVALYTDGVTEGANPAGEQWGEERLIGTLRAVTGGQPVSWVAAEIARAVRAFEGGAGPTDDITLLLARRDA